MLIAPSKAQPLEFRPTSPTIINMLVMDRGAGGIEHIVTDIVSSWRRLELRKIRIRANIFVFGEHQLMYDMLSAVDDRPTHIRIHNLNAYPESQLISYVTIRTLASGSSTLLTHSIPSSMMRQLWVRGIATIPVVLDTQQIDVPDSALVCRRKIPGIIAVSKTSADNLWAYGDRVPLHKIVNRTLLSADVGQNVASAARDEQIAASEEANATVRKHDLLSLVWGWIPSHSVEISKIQEMRSVLFVTNNLGQGGAQRSLVNLLSELNIETGLIHVCVMGEVFADEYIEILQSRPLNIFSLRETSSPVRRAGRLLDYIKTANIQTVCFWNVQASVKAILAKIYRYRSDIRLIDVSPGPHMMESFDLAEDFLERLGFNRRSYFERLDCFVAKYRDTSVPEGCGSLDGRFIVIPNGVPENSWERGEKELLRPNAVDAQKAIIVCGRIVPAKMTDRVLRVAAKLRDLDPGISVTIVGHIEHEQHADYWNEIQGLYKQLNLEGTVYFRSARVDSQAFFNEFKVLLMLSHLQGCPNTSLEAMMCGLPVVANPDGGTGEQVINGVTGFLIDESDIEDIARKIQWLLDYPQEAKAMGERGRAHVIRNFSMRRMVDQYRSLLWPQSDHNQAVK